METGRVKQGATGLVNDTADVCGSWCSPWTSARLLIMDLMVEMCRMAMVACPVPKPGSDHETVLTPASYNG